jgi:hypothetical protein
MKKKILTLKILISKQKGINYTYFVKKLKRE